MNQRPIFLCLASYFKGHLFMQEAHRLGAHVILLTREKLKDEAWPAESIDERFLMPSLHKLPDVLHAVSYLMRDRAIDQIIPLDDYDVPTAAALREHLRLDGMGETVTRHFRDKLAMRQRARALGIPVPDFEGVLNYNRLRDLMQRTPAPWVLKPRLEAGAMGIKKLSQPEALWGWLERLGDEQSYYLLEQFIPGEVYHVDSIVWQGEVLLAAPHRYGRPPINVAHEGGVFISRSLEPEADVAADLLALNRQLLLGFGMTRGVAHTEFIQAADGRLFFLETAARVGGASLDQLTQAATGVNPWLEWARLEMAHVQGQPYTLPPLHHRQAAILVCLARQEYPDLSAYAAPEVVWRMDKKQHAGLILATEDGARLDNLLDEYGRRFAYDFLAVAPPLDRAPE